MGLVHEAWYRKTGLVNMWNAAQPYPNEDDSWQRIIDGLNGALQTGLSVASAYDMFPAGMVGMGGVGTVAGMGAYQRHLNNRYGEIPTETQRLAKENTDKITG